MSSASTGTLVARPIPSDQKGVGVPRIASRMSFWVEVESLRPLMRLDTENPVTKAASSVTAAASHVPPPLLKQLKPGGRLVIPVGSAFQVQQLVLVQKAADGAISTRQILPVSFVPLTGDHD